MSTLKAYGNVVNNVFQLIGTLENDITKSIAWVMSKCPPFLLEIIKYALDIDVNADDVYIEYQNYEEKKGITDLEITDRKTFCSYYSQIF